METIQKLNQKELKNKLVKALGEENATKFLGIAPAILESELDKTIAEFPRLHKSQVIRLFENVANVKKSDSISGGRIFRPTLISLIESLEAYTGRKMLEKSSPDKPYAPLHYLEVANEQSIAKPFKVRDITIEDIADFFSERINRRIEHLIAKSNMPQAKEKDRSADAIQLFLQGCCKQPLKNDTKICDLVPQDVPAGQESYYIVLFWMEQQYDKMLPKEKNRKKRRTITVPLFFYTFNLSLAWHKS